MYQTKPYTCLIVLWTTTDIRRVLIHVPLSPFDAWHPKPVPSECADDQPINDILYATIAFNRTLLLLLLLLLIGM